MKALEKLEIQENKKQLKSVIKKLNDKLNELEQLKNKDELSQWHTYLVSFVSNILEPKSSQFIQIQRNSIYDIGVIFSKSFEEEKNNAKLILQGFIDSLSINGLPQKNNNDRGINVNNSTTVNQHQTINVDILQILHEELGNAKIRELESLIKKENTDKSKFAVITNALRDLGIETLSSTLAKVLLGYLGKN